MFGKDLLYLLAGTLQVVATLLLTPIVTRVLGPAGYGNVALALAVSQVVAVLTSLGLQTAIQRENAGPNGLRYTRRILGGVWLVGAVSAAGLSVSSRYWAKLFIPSAHGADLIGRYAAIWGCCAAINTVSLALLRSRERLSFYLAVSAIQSIGGQLLGLAIVDTFRNGAVSYLTGMIIGQAASALISAYALRPRFPSIRDIGLFHRVLPFSLPLIPQQMSGFLLNAGDRLIIQRDAGSAANGRYSAAYVIGSFAMVVLTLVNQVWLPRVFRVESGPEREVLVDAMRSLLERLLRPIVIGLAFATPLALSIFVPASFKPAKLIIISCTVLASTLPSGRYTTNLWILLGEGRTGRLALATLVSAVGNILLNILLIPFMGIEGSAIATLLAYLALAWLSGLAARAGRFRAEGLGLIRSMPTIGVGLVCIASSLIPVTEGWMTARLLVATGCAIWLGCIFRDFRKVPTAS